MKLEIYKNKEMEEITDNFYIVYKLFEVLDEKQQKSPWIKRNKTANLCGAPTRKRRILCSFTIHSAEPRKNLYRTSQAR